MDKEPKLEYSIGVMNNAIVQVKEFVKTCYTAPMITPNSKEIKKGDIFFCLPGGEPYIEDAKKRGAESILYGDRQEMARVGNERYNHPSKELVVIGITGTNGKTTVSFLIHKVLEKLGRKSCVSGTLSDRLTTPESIETLGKMRKHLESGGSHYIMEVSSHGIDQGRHWGVEFDVRCLTNITQDHLDYHKTIEAYKKVKEQFLLEGDGIKIRSENILDVPDIVNPYVKGDFNQINLKTAYACLFAIGEDPKSVINELSSVKGPPGRFEYINCGQEFEVVVDYAHTEDGLKNVLESIRKIKQRRCLVVFGCGGDRDKEKRPLMGSVVSEYADVIVITNDNPRSEEPQVIADQIKAGIKTEIKVHQILDRKEAIKYVLSNAKAGDTILIAGKGHEKTQEIGGKRVPFDDREIVRELLGSKR